jgi:AcrR family transcriptional regulator
VRGTAGLVDFVVFPLIAASTMTGVLRGMDRNVDGDPAAWTQETNVRYFLRMGRIAGVTAEETKQRLLDTAATVFARRGYAGASIAEITSDAGLSSGAVYAHYRGKAELFVATLRAHGERELEAMLGLGSPLAVLAAKGEALDRRSPAERTLLVQAIVAAQSDPDVAAVLKEAFADRAANIAGLLRSAIAPDVSAEAAARFTLMVALGSLLVAALDLPPVDHDDWTGLISRLIDSIRPEEA